MKSYSGLIQSTGLLNTLSVDEIDTHLHSGHFRVVSYDKDFIIHLDGELCNKLEIVLMGKVVVNRIDEAGNLLTIAEFSEDDIIGGNLLFSSTPVYPMTVSTQSATLMLEVEKESFFELLCSNTTLLRTYLELVSGHAFILGDKIKHYTHKTLRERIMNFLNHESKIQNSNHIRLNMTKKALSERIGCQRTSLSRELAKMKKDGVIMFDANSITLLDK